MRNALIIASVASMIDQFNMPNIDLLRKMNYHVDVACNFVEGNTCTKERVAELKKKLKAQGVGCFQIDFARDVTKLGQNAGAYRQLKTVAKEGKYALVHCHTPIGGVLGRIVFRKYRKTGTRVIYTAHGFHFFAGAPLKNWILYYPVEKFLSGWTDCLITINKEDYGRAKKKFRAKRTEYVPGIGIDLEKMEAVREKREEKRKEIAVPQDAYLLLSVGELSIRKNHKLVLQALCGLEEENVYYAICGQGELEKELKGFAGEHGLLGRVKFLGYRTDVLELCRAADLFVFPSLQEGLPVALMEAMACGVPCVASDIRGNRDLFGKDGEKYLLPLDKAEVWTKSVRYCMQHPGEKEERVENQEKKMFSFSKDVVMKRMKEIYENIVRKKQKRTNSIYKTMLLRRINGLK